MLLCTLCRSVYMCVYIYCDALCGVQSVHGTGNNEFKVHNKIKWNTTVYRLELGGKVSVSSSAKSVIQIESSLSRSRVWHTGTNSQPDQGEVGGRVVRQARVIHVAGSQTFKGKGTQPTSSIITQYPRRISITSTTSTTSTVLSYLCPVPRVLIVCRWVPLTSRRFFQFGWLLV